MVSLTFRHFCLHFIKLIRLFHFFVDTVNDTRFFIIKRVLYFMRVRALKVWVEISVGIFLNFT